MNFTRNDAALYILFVGCIWAAALYLRADSPLEQRIVVGGIGIAVLYILRWIANEFCVENDALTRRIGT